MDLNELSLAQQFEYEKMRLAAQHLPRKELEDLLIAARRLLIVKSNLARDLGGQVVNRADRPSSK